MFECSGELVNVNMVVLIHRHFFQGYYLMWDVWCVWWGCLDGAECFFDVLDNDGEAL